MRKMLIGGLMAAALLGAAPAWAHGGHGHGKHAKHWLGHPGGHYVQRHYVVREVVRPVPVYPRAAYPVYPVYSAPAAGIHVVLPNVFIPF